MNDEQCQTMNSIWLSNSHALFLYFISVYNTSQHSVHISLAIELQYIRLQCSLRFLVCKKVIARHSLKDINLLKSYAIFYQKISFLARFIYSMTEVRLVLT